MKEFTYHLMELNELRQILDPDIDDNGNADFDNRLAGAIDYFMPILLAIKAEAQQEKAE